MPRLLQRKRDGELVTLSLQKTRHRFGPGPAVASLTSQQREALASAILRQQAQDTQLVARLQTLQQSSTPTAAQQQQVSAVLAAVQQRQSANTRLSTLIQQQVATQRR
jgi:hypothetical protein